jgi:Flp pilus assembly protein TadD
MFGYYQGGLVVEMLTRDHGFQKVVQMLVAYGEDRPAPAILKDVFGLTYDEFDRQFLAFVEQKLKPIKLRPSYQPAKVDQMLDQVRGTPGDVGLRVRLAWGLLQNGNLADCRVQLAEALRLEPENPQAMLLRAELARVRKPARRGIGSPGEGVRRRRGRVPRASRRGRHAAEEGQRRRVARAPGAAKKCWATCADPGLSPHLRLARLDAAEDRTAEQIEEMMAFCAIAGRALEPRLMLAAHFGKAGDTEQQVRFLEEANRIDPFDRKLHVDLASGYVTMGRRADAVRELRVALAVPASLERAFLGQQPQAIPARGDASEVAFRGTCAPTWRSSCGRWATRTRPAPSCGA